MKKIISILGLVVLITGCATTTPKISIKEVYIPQKTNVNIIECNTQYYHDQINNLTNNVDSPTAGSDLVTIQWKLIDVLYNCIDRQTNEIRGKQ